MADFSSSVLSFCIEKCFSKSFLIEISDSEGFNYCFLLIILVDFSNYHFACLGLLTIFFANCIDYLSGICSGKTEAFI